MAKIARSTWRTQLLRWSVLSIGSLVLLAIISFFAVPPLAKRLVIEQVQEKIGRKIAIGDINFDPSSITLTASDITLYEPDQTTPAFSTKTLIINASLASLYRRALVLDEAKLIAPTLHVVRVGTEGYGRYNFTDVIERILAMPKSPEPLRFSVANIQLDGGTIRFDDKVLNKQVNVEALHIGLPFISNFPSAVNNFVTPGLSAKINGAPFDLKARSKPFTATQETTLALDVEQLDLASYIAFSPVPLPVDIKSAKLSTKLDLSFSRNAKKPEVVLSGETTLSELVVTDKAAQPILKMQSIHADIDKFNPLTGNAAFKKIAVNAPEVWAGLDSKGQLNWARIAANDSKPSVTKKPAAAASATPLVLSLRDLSIQHGSINWSDEAHASPRQDVQLKEITLNAAQLSTAADAPPASVTLSALGSDGETMRFAGQVNPAKAAIAGQAELSRLSLASYQGYVNRALTASLAGQVSAKTQIVAEGPRVQLANLGIEVSDLKLDAKSGQKGGIAAKSIVLENAKLDTESRDMNADALRLTGLRGDIRRDSNGRLNLLQFIASSNKSPAPNPVATGTVSDSPTWNASVKTLALSDSAMAFVDNAVAPTVSLRADNINLELENASSSLRQAIKLSLQTTVNRSGKLSLTGNIAEQMKSVEMSVDGRNLPVAVLQPYFSDYVNVSLTNGQVSAKGKVTVVPGSKGKPLAASYNGMANLTNFSVLDKESASDFLKWKSLYLSGIDVKVGSAPPQIALSKVALSDFYARIILSEAGKLNLQDVLVSKSGQTSVADKATPTGSSPETVPATKPNTTTSAQLPASPSKSSAPSAVIRINQTTLQGGNINFTDHFIKPNYSANLTDMGGNIGAIASDNQQAAAIDLRGKVDNDAPILVSGSLNPLSKPIFLDMKASAKGIELTRLTPYAAKYAGYAIEKGKLSMDVSYHIENDQLLAQNNVNLDQLTFGEKIESPDAVKLPVLLAVALLKNRQGVIDINLPISGSLSDPQFSVGGIIFRVLVNVIAKAVTAPFSLLGAAFGGGDELGYAEFSPGLAALTPTTQSKLDNLAKALKERPALKLDITGRVDPETDAEGVRQASLVQKIKTLKLKELLRQGQDVQPEEVTLTDADKAQYLERVYKDEKFAKPRNLIGLAKSLPSEEMKRLILANTQVKPEDLRALAIHRADTVREYLEQKGEIPHERVFMIAPKMTTDGIQDKGKANRVDFSLK